MSIDTLPKPPNFRPFHQARVGVRGPERAIWPPHQALSPATCTP